MSFNKEQYMEGFANKLSEIFPDVSGKYLYLTNFRINLDAYDYEWTTGLNTDDAETMYNMAHDYFHRRYHDNRCILIAHVITVDNENNHDIGWVSLTATADYESTFSQIPESLLALSTGGGQYSVLSVIGIGIHLEEI